MRRTVLVFGAIGGVLVALLRVVEYRFLVVEHSLQVYGALVAVVFAGVGLWLGITIASRSRHAGVKEDPVPVESRAEAPGPTPGPGTGRNTARQAQLAITAREMEILELIAAGLSNREIAETLFVSENTVKTHSGRLLGKLGAKRRTQAVQRARDEGLIA